MNKQIRDRTLQPNGQCHIYEAHIIQANKPFWFSAVEIVTKTKQILNY